MAYRYVTIGFFPFLGSIVLAGSGSAQTRAPRELVAPGEERACRHVVFDGFVLSADGTPAEGVMVTSSAGGRTITDPSGRYRLDVAVPRAARIVHITAADGTDAGPSASTRFELGLASGAARVDPLQLGPAPCQPRWLHTFGGQPGVDDTVSALVEFDDGNGPALYAGGTFLLAGKLEANHIARWDGTSWSTLGSGLLDAEGGPHANVSTLAVFDDGSGPALFAGGNFRMAGGETATNVAKWDGTSWSPLGGLNFNAMAMAVFDDSSGQALYVGGLFTNAGGTTANRIAKWNGGTSWSALGSGLNDYVYALAVFDDGSGPALYAAGTFTTAGGVAANRVAKWDGASWSALGSGLAGGPSPAAVALAVFDDGSGPALFVGGQFTTAGGVAASHIAKWDGASWSALGSGLNSGASELTVHDDGSGPALYAGGGFTTAGGVPANRIARWDGASWSALGAGTDNSVLALTTFDGGGGPVLVAGGNFATADTFAASRLGMWDGSGWSAFSGPTSWLNGTVHAMAVHDDGGGPAFYAGGYFSIPGMPAGNRIARWDGTGWSALGGGVNGPVGALAVHDDGSGPALYASGGFTSAGGVAVNHIARWDGTSWSALGSGLSGGGTLAVHDDGSGPALYAGGGFYGGPFPSGWVKRWDGTSWSALGGGMDGPVECLAVFDDGTGPALHAGGFFFDAGGVAVNQVAKWDGSSWSDLNGGINEVFDAMAVYDDGSGPSLYVAMTDGFISPEIWRWDGSSWTFFDGVGGGFDGGRVVAMTAYDDGSGPSLYITGDFTIVGAGGVAAQGVAKWDGSSWTPLGSGLIAGALSLLGHEASNLKGLYAGGAVALDSGDGPVAKWGCVPVAGKNKVRPR